MQSQIYYKINVALDYKLLINAELDYKINDNARLRHY
jgi:hypothetical protein